MSIPAPGTTSKGSDSTLLTVFAVSAALLLLVLIEPLGADNAVLHSIARDWVYYGRVPYIGSWDNNFPGIMLLHAVDIGVLGVSGLAFRAFDIAIQLAFVVFLYRFLARWLPRHTAALAAVLYTLYYVTGGTYLIGQQDGYGMMLVLLSTAILSKDNKPRIPRVAFAAVIVGLSVLMRPTFLLYPGLLSLYLITTENLKISARRIPIGLLFFVLSLLPLSVLLAYYATIPGGVQSFYISTIRFNLDLYTNLRGGSLWVELARTGLLIPFALFAGFALIRRRMSFAISKRDTALYLSYIVGGLFTVILMAKYWRYQFAPFYMALIPLTAIGIDHAIGHLHSEVRRHFAMLLSLGLCSFIYYNPVAPLAFAVGALEHRNPFLAAEEARRQMGYSRVDEERGVLSFLDQEDHRGETVEVCGFEPYLRLNLDRECVGPYVSFHSIGFRLDSTQTNSHPDYQRQWQRNYVDELTTRHPHFIILLRNSGFWYLHDIYNDVLSSLPGFSAMFENHYVLRRTIGRYEIYERNS